MPKSPPVKWTRDHFLIALNLYRKLPFGRLDKKNSLIIQVAGKMGRTPDSLAMKLTNFASLDPVILASGKKGLKGATPQDRRMWDEFQSNLVELGPESEQLLHDLFTADANVEIDLLNGKSVRIERPRIFGGQTERIASIKLRRGQQFFRQSVLNSYGVQCCISGVDHPRLLVASHIKPWRDCLEDRLDPSNGLCLSSLHDDAFDSGLITLDQQFRLVLSEELKGKLDRLNLQQSFLAYEGKPIRMPKKVAEPSQEFLAYHRSSIFRR